MKITNIYIKNFRSIREIGFNPNQGLNAFIGGNSTGKSNIFEAINWVLGSFYPSFNSVKKEDHFKGIETNRIIIKLFFDDGHWLELNEAKETTNYQGFPEIKSGLFYDNTNYNCKKEIREKYCSAHIGIERQITDYSPSNKRSLLGSMLQEINDRFSEERVENETILKSVKLKQELDRIKTELLFSVRDESGNNIMEEFLKILQKESAKQLNCPESDFNICLSLYNPWHFYRTLQLIVKENEFGLDFQASQMGMGVQASLTIAILKAYACIKLRNQPPIFIDEPELFLHPHAQKNFYKILRELSASGSQIFYATHSSDFLSVGSFDEIFIVRKNSEGSYLKYADLNKFQTDLRLRVGIETDKEALKLHYKNAYENTGDSKAANEAFFAKKIILVEGSSESLLLPYFFNKFDFDYIKEGISIVSCGTKGEIDRFLRLFREFGIPCYIIFDGDKHLEVTDERADNIRKNKALFSILEPSYNMDYPNNAVKSNYFGFEDELYMTT